MTTTTIDPKIFQDVQGRWRTQSLFVETADPKIALKYPPIFLLTEPEDRDGLTSMRRIYMEQADPTELRVALSIFGCWDAWENLCRAPFFQPELKKWRTELAQRLRSDATKVIIGAGLWGDKVSSVQFSAAKWVAEQGWLNYTPTPEGGPNALSSSDGGDPVSTSRSAGRPSKAAITAEAERTLRAKLAALETAEEDAKRLGF